MADLFAPVLGVARTGCPSNTDSVLSVMQYMALLTWNCFLQTPFPGNVSKLCHHGTSSGWQVCEYQLMHSVYFGINTPVLPPKPLLKPGSHTVNIS